MALHRKDDFWLLVYAYDIRRMSVGGNSHGYGMLVINIHEPEAYPLCVFGTKHVEDIIYVSRVRHWLHGLSIARLLANSDSFRACYRAGG